MGVLEVIIFEILVYCSGVVLRGLYVDYAEQCRASQDYEARQQRQAEREAERKARIEKIEMAVKVRYPTARVRAWYQGMDLTYRVLVEGGFKWFEGIIESDFQDWELCVWVSSLPDINPKLLAA